MNQSITVIFDGKVLHPEKPLINKKISIMIKPSNNSYTRCRNNTNEYCLRRGDRGELVRELINNLTCVGYYSGVNDSVFGSGTERGISNFQRDHGLTVDGIAGTQTQNLLNQQCIANRNDNGIHGQVVFQVDNMYDHSVRNSDNDNIPSQDNIGNIMATKNIEQLNSNLGFSLLIYQDGVSCYAFKPVM
jgi:peptidoglycan hydrolase-like protein with peptidoglycan-binding domain